MSDPKPKVGGHKFRSSATRVSADGHVRAGGGIGGPAKGPGSPAPVGPKPQNMLKAGFVNGKPGPLITPEMIARKAAREGRKEEALIELTDQLIDKAFNAKEEALQVTATVHALNRLGGMPKQMNEHAGHLTLEALVLAAARRIESEGVEAPEPE